METQPTMIAFIGQPGSGKTTQARGVVTSPEYVGRSAHISIGQEVRDIRAGRIDSIVARDIDIHYRSGDHYQLLPDDIVDQIAIDALRRYRDSDLDLIAIDGIPRRISQISDLLWLASGSNYRLGGVIHTTVDRDEAFVRLLGRRTRLDDDEPEVTAAIAQRRLDLYEQDSLGVPQALRYQGIPVHDIPTDAPKELTLPKVLGSVSIMCAAPQLRADREPA